MYKNAGGHDGVSRSPLNPQANPFGNALYETGSDLIRGELGAYGERLLGTSSEYVQTNGHWIRITERVGGKLSYKPPIYDINAPDLYIPLMAFGTYMVLAGFLLGLHGKFSPEALSIQFTKGMIGWLLQVLLLKATLHSLGSVEAPLLDAVAYGGYAFTGVALALLAKIVWSYSYYIVIMWGCFCMGVFLVKIMKRVLFAEVRIYDKYSSKRHYLLLFMALAQIPLLFWLGNIGV
ncbi:hypothetical protein HHK36_025925 [Tetracentron sinense]|uniref:Uncharacterized protein n=1 Tax=Tetracentron sinense TaxID=13715 RepID=A0A834YIS4_TETSI|nr:hypothetical protein HHK36_025925 [Tetracentron sinense]